MSQMTTAEQALKRNGFQTPEELAQQAGSKPKGLLDLFQTIAAKTDGESVPGGSPTTEMQLNARILGRRVPDGTCPIT